MRRTRNTYCNVPTLFYTYSLVLPLLLFLLTCLPGYGQQEGEFQKNANGLIYSDHTIQQLRHMVDSLNLKFKVCKLNPTYRARPQAIGHYILVNGRQAKSALAAMEQHMPFEDFIKKYRPKEVEENLLVIKSNYENYKGKPTVAFRSVSFGEAEQYEFEFEENLTRFEKPMQGKWIFENNASANSTKEGLAAIYITHDFTRKPLPAKYARMVKYSDCLVDTTAQVFLPGAQRSGGWIEEKEAPEKLTAFLNYVAQVTKKPEFDEKNYNAFLANLRYWQNSRWRILERLATEKGQFKEMLHQAVTEVLEKGGSNEEFEAYVAAYYSSKTALALKRGRIVEGSCSMDRSPRQHALAIAQLSAETVNWEIFLRAHLDIMNDRFNRATDGSYAWGARKTYLRELEVLDINVPDLLLGITLRIDNPATNHYFGDISRLGRALSEAEQAARLEQQLLSFISDLELDDYNRVLLYYLFLNYNHHLENKEKQSENIRRLNEAVKTLPAYLAARAVLKN